MQSQGMRSSLCDCCKLCWLGSVTCVVVATTQPLETANLPQARGPAYPLRPGSLYIGLWARTDTFGPDAFHWGLYHHFWNSQGQTRQTQGRKYHIRNYNNYWIQDFGTTASAMNSLLLVCFIRIADIPADQDANLLTLLSGLPFNTPGITCRIWVFNAIEALIMHRFMRPTNLQALEQEAWTFGQAFFNATVNNQQPRPVVDSRLCYLLPWSNLVSSLTRNIYKA